MVISSFFFLFFFSIDQELAPFEDDSESETEEAAPDGVLLELYPSRFVTVGCGRRSKVPVLKKTASIQCVVKSGSLISTDSDLPVEEDCDDEEKEEWPEVYDVHSKASRLPASC